MEKQGRYKKQRIEFFLANFIAGKIAGDVTILSGDRRAYVRLAARRVFRAASALGCNHHQSSAAPALVERDERRGKATIARSSAVSDRPAGGVRPCIQEL
jgi:hypothetical protein